MAHTPRVARCREDSQICKPNCKPTTRHRPVSGNTSEHRWLRNAKRKHTFSYWPGTTFSAIPC